MKKVLIILCVIAAVIFMLDEEPKKVTYSEEEMREAIYEAEKRGYEEGYDLAKYEDKGEVESIRKQLEREIEGIKEEYSYYMDSAYDAGYEAGYDDCLEAHGLVEESTFDPNDPPRIKKDK